MVFVRSSLITLYLAERINKMEQVAEGSWKRTLMFLLWSGVFVFVGFGGVSQVGAAENCEEYVDIIPSKDSGDTCWPLAREPKYPDMITLEWVRVPKYPDMITLDKAL